MSEMPFELKDRSVVSDRLKAKRVVLITGAGASRGLGADKPMPLMPDWAGILSHDIDESNPGISEVLGIREGISGEEFEENLGKFLQWQQSFPLNDRFKRFGGVSIAGAPSPPVEEWLRNNKTRAAEVGEALQRSLYSNFGLQAVDRSKAIEAYRRLDRVLGGEDTQKICATTNYDPCVEVGFGGFGYRIVDGFDRSQPFQTPVFEPSDLGNWRKYSPDTLPILHLHGAVGWYRQRNGSVISCTRPLTARSSPSSCSRRRAEQGPSAHRHQGPQLDSSRPPALGYTCRARIRRGHGRTIMGACLARRGLARRVSRPS